MMVRVVLPTHLYRLANTDRMVEIQVEDEPTLAATLEALEARFPMLRGAIRDHTTKQRRPFIRFFACGEDLSHEPGESVLPESVQRGDEPLRIVGAMAGG
jgi:sulfur-carrier protein